MDYELIEELIDGKVLKSKPIMESISEAHRLIAKKRLLLMVVHDDEVDKVIDIIMDINSSGNMGGDGKKYLYALYWMQCVLGQMKQGKKQCNQSIVKVR